MKVIFLDIDGVLMNEKAYSEPVASRYVRHTPDQSCVEQLNRIIEETGASIVVSSVWRFRDRIAEILADWKVSGKVVGVTPGLRDAIRGDEIDLWLRRNPSVKSFVIIDDDSDMGALRPRLVQTRSVPGLTREDADKAIEILRKER